MYVVYDLMKMNFILDQSIFKALELTIYYYNIYIF